MKVFISWSGKKSHAVAVALHEWFPTVINSVVPWISSDGLRAGLKWNQQLEQELNGTSFGIVVVTPSNQGAQWLNFEAGALSKKVGGAESRVVPLLIDFDKPTDLVGPLASYQATLPTKDGFRDLVASINEALGESARPLELLERGFEVCWPALEARLQEIESENGKDILAEAPPAPSTASSSGRSPDDMLAEILSTVRDMNRSDVRLKNALVHQTTTGTSSVLRDPKFFRDHLSSSVIANYLQEQGVDVLGIKATLDGTVRIRLRRKLPRAVEHKLQAHLTAGDFGISRVVFDYAAVKLSDESESLEAIPDSAMGSKEGS